MPGKWNFMNALSGRRAGVVREGVVEKDAVLDAVLEEMCIPFSLSTPESYWLGLVCRGRAGGGDSGEPGGSGGG